MNLSAEDFRSSFPSSVDYQEVSIFLFPKDSKNLQNDHLYSLIRRFEGLVKGFSEGFGELNSVLAKLQVDLEGISFRCSTKQKEWLRDFVTERLKSENTKQPYWSDFDAALDRFSPEEYSDQVFYDLARLNHFIRFSCSVTSSQSKNMKTTADDRELAQKGSLVVAMQQVLISLYLLYAYLVHSHIDTDNASSGSGGFEWAARMCYSVHSLLSLSIYFLERYARALESWDYGNHMMLATRQAKTFILKRR